MVPRLVSLLLLASGTGALVYAQNPAVFPPAAFAAHTVAVLNETHNSGVLNGALGELREWNHWKVIDDPSSADLVLDFNRKSSHDGSSSDKPGDDGKPSYSYSMSFGSSVHMTATTKDGFSPFYTTTTDDDKQKAGRECVQAFIAAYQDAQRHEHPPLAPPGQ
jgi:hypothetical protein